MIRRKLAWVAVAALVLSLAGKDAAQAEGISELLDRLRPVSVDESAVREMAGRDRFKPYVLNPILTTGMQTKDEWDAGALGSASVVRVNGVYHMYYEAWGKLSVEGTKDEYDSLQIGHAVSLDGIHWAKDHANPILRKGSVGAWNEHGVWDPYVIYENGKFKMWFGGNQGSQCEWAYAVSQDGRKFEVHGPISELGGVEDIHVVHGDKPGEYLAYYWNREKAPWEEVMAGPPGAPSGLFAARSPNETGFEFNQAQRIEIEGQKWPGKQSHVIRCDGNWYMFFGKAVTRGHRSQTGLAVSADGFEWKKKAFPILAGQDAEVIEAAPNLWLMYYGPPDHFDWPECDLRLAIYEGSLEHLSTVPEHIEQGD